MTRALIGHTGFVGGTLFADGRYTHGFNSTNFRDMAGQQFDEIVCAGIPAVKWLANKEPERDHAAIMALLDVLATVRAGRFVLISTIDVYPDPSRPLDEDAVLRGQANHAYGRHRLIVEEWVAERFAVHAIVRLPALFGAGLKKNVIFDLLHGNQTDKINPAAAFQWYPTRRLATDLSLIAAAGLRQVNLFTEPVATREIVGRFFPGAVTGPETEPAPRYDVRTKHGRLFGGGADYAVDAAQVLRDMAEYVARERRA
jgi:hypothetical protein